MSDSYAAVADPDSRRVRLSIDGGQLELKPSQANALAFLLMRLADVAARRNVSTGRTPKDSTHG